MARGKYCRANFHTECIRSTLRRPSGSIGAVAPPISLRLDFLPIASIGSVLPRFLDRKRCNCAVTNFFRSDRQPRHADWHWDIDQDIRTGLATAMAIHDTEFKHLIGGDKHTSHSLWSAGRLRTKPAADRSAAVAKGLLIAVL